MKMTQLTIETIRETKKKTENHKFTQCERNKIEIIHTKLLIAAENIDNLDKDLEKIKQNIAKKINQTAELEKNKSQLNKYNKIWCYYMKKLNKIFKKYNKKIKSQ